jgi:RsiW-degrading membrane proteinase PrsW (M82 family)
MYCIKKCDSIPFMTGAGVFFILFFISSIPVLAALLWFHFARYPFSLPFFFVSLLAGAASFFPALFFQKLLASVNGFFAAAGKWRLFAEIFIRIAFTEELSRLLLLVILLLAARRLSASVTTASAAGLIAGLGFAILESAVYGAANPGNALLRTFTAAPLHGACGSRVGASVVMLRERPVQAAFRFLSAIAIHGIYNFMLIIPGRLPPITAVLIALSSLASSILSIHRGMGSGDA